MLPNEPDVYTLLYASVNVVWHFCNLLTVALHLGFLVPAVISDDGS